MYFATDAVCVVDIYHKHKIYSRRSAVIGKK